jgi:hypothetical protein
MPAKEENLSHEEIWDDSALVDSWNDALEEYKRYHSIHTKGGNVDDLLKSEGAAPDVKRESSQAQSEPPGSADAPSRDDTRVSRWPTKPCWIEAR